ncbi:hypothetical protein NW761_014924 [Fusarium oxysporum]|uniref:Uncharacterized protein n=2 Tax=Fusarium oxysporum TaxID=5507 RepID=W9Z3Y0_FUSOX|nr:hypothetical protein FOVG_15920 [Fusarium oxysporum f. sp. pisi HDV247]EXK26055.1 hypothetical protein FOMG_17334 [Fusarium oxysporum f. sp. melonis 26406]KAJ4029453.1 hypothetical protein NW753_014188 [Fusarium oxysporum]WKT52686.1 hypothetical protein QSH57_003248 [Fusarium oxysporum f. sp. vasinfectum]KAJ4034958.1 hypothetical protein NW763_014189 [Fusarium oxysporum]
MGSAQATRTISNLERLVDRDEALIRDWDETGAPRRLLPDGTYDETERLSKAYLKTDPRYAAAPEFPVRKDCMIYHSIPQDCELGQACNHWSILDEADWYNHPESLCLQVVAVRSDFVARGQSGFGLVHMFDDREPQQDRISTMTSYIFKCMKPDFSILERVGYTVVCWRLVDASPDAEIKWMDQYGRCM